MLDCLFLTCLLYLGTIQVLIDRQTTSFWSIQKEKESRRKPSWKIYHCSLLLYVSSLHKKPLYLYEIHSDYLLFTTGPVQCWVNRAEDPCSLLGAIEACVAQLVGALSHKQKGYRFESWSGHMPGLWVWSPVGVRMRSNWSIFLSHIDVSLPLFHPPFLSL